MIKKGLNKVSPLYRSLKININHSRLVYRYPYKYDNNKFCQKLARFIENDLSTNSYMELNEHHNRFYVDIVDGKIEFIDKQRFEEKERAYFKYHDRVGENYKSENSLMLDEENENDSD